jgi:hypothetical protein
MLDVVWRDAAQRLTLPGIIASVVLGLAGSISLMLANRLWPIATGCIIVVAFGAYAAIIQPAIGGIWLRSSTQRLLATLAATVAALAGLMTGLLLLAAIFGGSIEVMRR